MTETQLQDGRLHTCAGLHALIRDRRESVVMQGLVAQSELEKGTCQQSSDLASEESLLAPEKW